MDIELGMSAPSAGSINLRRHIAIGFLAGLLLLSAYAGVVSLAQGWQHMLEQAARLWYWMLPLAGGFGLQAGLFSFIRSALRERRKFTAAGVAASGGVSAASMAACCAHHLGEILPLIGVAGATAFLAEYQPLLMVLGLSSNFVGIALMLETIQRHRLCPLVSSLKWDMRLVTRGLMALAVLAVAFTGFRIFSGN